MRSLFTALTLSVITLSATALPASAATKQDVEGFLERLKSGDLDENVLLYPTADRRVAFAHINAWMPTRPLFPSENPYALTTEIDRDLERVSYQVGGETFTVGDFLKRHALHYLAKPLLPRYLWENHPVLTLYAIPSYANFHYPPEQ